jgi:4-hydroxy-4-methyl-2-oxoglutarate aldolase
MDPGGVPGEGGRRQRPCWGPRPAPGEKAGTLGCPPGGRRRPLGVEAMNRLRGARAPGEPGSWGTGDVDRTQAEEIRRRYARLTAALVSDALDALSLRHQTLSPGLELLDLARPVVGWVFPVEARGTDILAEAPYALEFEAVEACQPGEVFTVATDGTPSALWGELLSTRLMARGAAGGLVDGLTRDRARIVAMGFPLMVRGFHPADSHGRLEVVAYGRPVTVAGVEVHRGDLLVADGDGAVVVPASRVEEALRLAEEKQQAEGVVRQELRAGARVDDTFRRYKVM